jgi:hypothetical protein
VSKKVVKCSYAKRVNKYWLGWNASWLKSLSVVKIDVCKLISLTNAQTLDEHRHTREKLKGNEVLCMTNLDVPTMIPILPRHCLIYDPDSSLSVTVLYMILILPRHALFYIWSWFFPVIHCLIYDTDSSPSLSYISVLAVDDRNVTFCEYNGSVARIICVAVATLANEKLLKRASDNNLRIKRVIDNDLIDV